jgi:hypothetical protein
LLGGRLGMKASLAPVRRSAHATALERRAISRKTGLRNGADVCALGDARLMLPNDFRCVLTAFHGHFR